MKKYSDPMIDVVSFEMTDVTNSFEGGDNEVSAQVLFPNISIDW